MRFALLAPCLISSFTRLFLFSSLELVVNETLQSLCTPKENKNNYKYQLRTVLVVLFTR